MKKTTEFLNPKPILILNHVASGIRRKDVGYSQRQHNAISEYISRLRRERA